MNQLLKIISLSIYAYLLILLSQRTSINILNNKGGSESEFLESVKTLGTYAQLVAQACNLATLGMKQENGKFKVSFSNLVSSCFKLKINDCEYNSVVECLPNLHKALNSVFSLQQHTHARTHSHTLVGRGSRLSKHRYL